MSNICLAPRLSGNLTKKRNSRSWRSWRADPFFWGCSKLFPFFFLGGAYFSTSFQHWQGSCILPLVGYFSVGLFLDVVVVVSLANN